MNTQRSFDGPISVQFFEFGQQLMNRESGDAVFVGIARGVFGVPPNGERFEVRVKLSTGADFTDDAYEVEVHPDLAQLGARPDFRAAAFNYVDLALNAMFGETWRRLPAGVLAQNNLVQIPGAVTVIKFGESGPSTW